ncbi:MAG: hypothetical protein QOF76_2564 [Solirubrobacteraceae bacterium]|jgi:uncharacterized membrane protein|nr:hypothetical protein [Solirubrobacteraceae bacterium]
MSRAKLPVAGFFLFSGIAHLTFAKKFFEDIVPPWLPASPEAVNITAGVAEAAGGALALVPGQERLARRYLTALLLAVFPANINMTLRPQDSKTASKASPVVLWGRLPLQFVAIAWVQRSLRD